MQEIIFPVFCSTIAPTHSDVKLAYHYKVAQEIKQIANLKKLSFFHKYNIATECKNGFKITSNFI